MNGYILKLQDGRFFIGSTDDNNFLLSKHISNMWTSTYKPIKLLQLFKLSRPINEYVLVFMKKFGMDNVRGGSYSNIFLSKEQINTLNKCMIKTILKRDNKPDKLDIVAPLPLPYWVNNKKFNRVVKKEDIKCTDCNNIFESIRDLNIHTLLYCTKYKYNFFSPS